MARTDKRSLDRRKFLKNATAGGVATLVVSTGAVTARVPAQPQPASAPIMQKEIDPAEASGAEVLTMDRSGSDFMVDVFKGLGFEYIAANPGSSFRGLQESFINYGGNQAPEFITCCHEESAVGMAHGYSKIAGKPMLVPVHSTVGLQHASMAIYNGYCDRVPIFIVPGNSMNAATRRPGAEWDHSAQDVAAMVRDCLKWDDLPVSLQHFAESAVRAYKISVTPPAMPVLLVADSELQENPLAADTKFHIPKLTIPTPPQGDSGAVAEAARLLVAAENPVLIAGRAARTPAGMTHLVELAEALEASVIDQNDRMNFPTRHPLNQTDRSREVIANADVIMGLELADFWGTVNTMRDQIERTSRSIVKHGAKLISVTAEDLYAKGNYQDLQRYAEVDMAISADAETTLPSLIEAVKRLTTYDRKRTFELRRRKLAEAHQSALDRARTEATYGWDASPITTARLAAELWAQIRNEDWSLVSDVHFAGRWPLRLWSFDKHYQYIGGSGGAGEGYGAAATAGAALANKKYGRLSVSIQPDGDLMYAPGVLWTAAHHRIPLLMVMHNNRAYHQEVMHIQCMANRHNRGISRVSIGTKLDNPTINFARLAEGMGVHGEGPITDPKDLASAIGRALSVVKRGEPALVDAVTEPR